MRDVTLGFATAAGIGDDAIEVLPFVQPVAGVDFATVVVNGGEVWDVLAITGHLVNGVGAANRLPSIIVDDGTTTVGRFSTNVAQTAAITLDYTWTVVSGFAGVNLIGTGVVMPAPPFPLASGWRIRFLTANLQATDQWSAGALTVRRRVRDDHAFTPEDVSDASEREHELAHLAERLGI